MTYDQLSYSDQCKATRAIARQICGEIIQELGCDYRGTTEDLISVMAQALGEDWDSLVKSRAARAVYINANTPVIHITD
jgi:hypothetical protein